MSYIEHIKFTDLLLKIYEAITRSTLEKSPPDTLAVGSVK